jgi:hypothetical protein
MNDGSAWGLWSKVNVAGPADCWPWLGRRRIIGGYGQLVVDGRPVLAHRLAWTLANGPIPTGLFVCHSCDNPPCCNPRHLWVGTNADNVRDAMRKGRLGAGVVLPAPRAPYPWGGRRNDPERDAAMVEARKSGRTLADIGREFGVSHQRVAQVLKRRAA